MQQKAAINKCLQIVKVISFPVDTGELRFGLEAFGHDLVGCLAVQHPLTPVVVGGVEAAQKLLQVTVRVDVDPSPGIPAAARPEPWPAPPSTSEPMRPLKRSTMPLSGMMASVP